MKRTTFICLLLFITSLFSRAQEIISPNQNIKIIIDAKGGANGQNELIKFAVFCKENKKFKEVLPFSPLGITRKDQDFTNNLEVVSISKSVIIHEKYEMLIGKRSIRENFATEKTIKLKNSNGKLLNIIFRAYKDGIAFRYEFPESSNSPVSIIKESTTYILPEKTDRWIQEFEPSYEGFYPLSNDGKNNKQNHWGYPALYKVNNSALWGLISEADISENNCATSLSNATSNNHYNVVFPSSRDNFKQEGVIATLPWKSQWHSIMIGSIDNIVESTLIDDLSQPNQLGNIDWIKPGAASWIYWASNHGSKDYKKVVSYIDLAKEMNWPYVLIDWEWDVMANGGNVIDAINYAKKQGIKSMLWYNSGTSWLEPTPWDRLLTAEKREKEFSWLNEIGVSGIKVDFFAGDQQDMMKTYVDILKDAARHKLVVNFHGATLPRGWARTYPNLLTTEAVYGAEWYNNLPVMTNAAAKHNATLPFTRNVVGSMDYTPVTFSDSQHPHITTFGHELATSVVFESALQHFADTPDAYNNLPVDAKEFLKIVPTVWDDTKLLDGFPGDNVVAARRKGNSWYIGGLNGTDTEKIFKFNLKKLTSKKGSIKIITDGTNDKSFSVQNLIFSPQDPINIKCLPRGGFVAIVTDLKGS